MHARAKQRAAELNAIRGGIARVDVSLLADLEVAAAIGAAFGDQDFSLSDRTSWAVMQPDWCGVRGPRLLPVGSHQLGRDGAARHRRSGLAGSRLPHLPVRSPTAPSSRRRAVTLLPGSVTAELLASAEN